MAKAKLSKEAIKFIIETYECEKITYTFPEIMDLVAEKYGIKVSAESIRQSYHKNKDSFNKEQKAVSKSSLDNVEKKVLENEKSDSETKEQVKPIKRKLNFERKVTQTPRKSGFDETLGQEITKDNLEDYL